MEKKTNYGKIIAITLAVVAAFAAMAFIVYKLFVKELAKVYAHENHEDDMFLEEDDTCDCECIQCDAAGDVE